MQSIAETCVRFDAAHLSINLVSEIAVPMFTTLILAIVRPNSRIMHSIYSWPMNFITMIPASVLPDRTQSFCLVR